MSHPSTSTAEPHTMAELGRFWTFANGLSLARMLLVVPIAALVWAADQPALMWALVALGVATDFFDGKVARWTGTVSEWGKVLDPLADKLAAVAVGGALAFRPSEPNLPVWLIGLVLVRDVLIFGGGVLIARRHGSVPPSVWSGKLAVGAVTVAVLAALLGLIEVVQIAVWTALVLLVFSFGRYLTRFVRAMRLPPTVDPPVV
jgi:CDP-diacylglycerol--glycerol-3-phosphate 3-phosphatidyltransferase